MIVKIDPGNPDRFDVSHRTGGQAKPARMGQTRLSATGGSAGPRRT